MHSQCSIANLFEACKGFRRYVFRACLYAAGAGVLVRYLYWADSQLPDFNEDAFAVFSLGQASDTLRLEMLPAQLFVGGIFVGLGVAVVLLCYAILDDMCAYGAKLRQETAAKRASPPAAAN